MQLAGRHVSEAHVAQALDRLGLVHLRLEAVAILPALAAAPPVPAQETRLIHKSGIVIRGGGVQGATGTDSKSVEFTQRDVAHGLRQRDELRSGLSLGGGFDAQLASGAGT